MIQNKFVSGDKDPLLLLLMAEGLDLQMDARLADNI